MSNKPPLSMSQIHFVLDLLIIGFKVKLYDIESGCRGLISMDNSNRLYALCHAIPGFIFKQVDFRHFKKFYSKTAFIASFTVYKSLFFHKNQLGAIHH